MELRPPQKGQVRLEFVKYVNFSEYEYAPGFNYEFYQWNI